MYAFGPHESTTYLSAHNHSYFQAQFHFGLTGVTDPDFGCFASTNLTHKLAVKYVFH